ncbi:hypothetical protein EX895_001093 [Sporisorium graminicola]|uniref:Uncharacterized protein n=1 Tax=Sporisorium graminicola TaxID=280036 RepID=A0A4U7KZG4_9BASI|nr:hypothetical protein EX895_001093 [Sporisorium graminicola]TKY89796.1 hypothetical protein EX895_001093 [Sporisorium graminicola]
MGSIRRPFTCSRTCTPHASLLASREVRRAISSTAGARYQHVLYLGDVLGYNSVDRLSKFPRAWLDAVGVSADVGHGLRWERVAGGVQHALLAYTLLDQPLAPASPRREAEELVAPGTAVVEPREEGAEEQVLEEAGGRRASSSQPSKVFAVGRNTHAQLGLGFSSQEATRGMVTGQLTGERGVQSVVAAGTFSLVVTEDSAGQSNVWGFGNDTLGQIGSSSAAASAASPASGTDPYDVSTRLSESDAPQLRLLPLPKRIPLDGEGWTVKSSAAGVDHSLLLLERELNGYTIQQVVSTGLNTDGQLGITPDSHKDAVPIPPLLSRSLQPVPIPLAPFPSCSAAAGGDQGARVMQVVCGADTSYAVTQAGDLWVWGNSEYGQTLAGVQDRIVAPVRVPNPLPAAYAAHGIAAACQGPVPRVRKLVAGGSFAALLDTCGRVWTVGHAPRPTTTTTTTNADTPADETLTLVQGLPGKATQLFCGLEYLLATTDTADQTDEVYLWGIPPRSLSSQPILEPTRIPYSIPKTPRQTWLDQNPRVKQEQQPQRRYGKLRVEAAACTRDHILLLVNDGVGKDYWAECDQPPRDKGTDVSF